MNPDERKLALAAVNEAFSDSVRQFTKNLIGGAMVAEDVRECLNAVSGHRATMLQILEEGKND